MPATISYLSVAPDTAIPMRVFVNRRKLLSSSAVAVNEKSMIKLSSINSIRLSNFDLTNMVLDLGTEIRKLLLDTPLKELFPQRSVSRSSQLVSEISHTWTCKVVVSLGYLADLRYKLSCLHSSKDFSFLDEKKIELEHRIGEGSALLQKTMKFDFMKNEPASDDEGLGSDEKKSLTYKLQKQRLLNSSVVDTFDMYVLHRPRS